MNKMNTEKLIDELNKMIGRNKAYMSDVKNERQMGIYEGQISACRYVIDLIKTYSDYSQPEDEPSQPEDNTDKLSVGLDDEEMRQLIHDLIIYFDTDQLINLVNYLLSHMKVE